MNFFGRVPAKGNAVVDSGARLPVETLRLWTAQAVAGVGLSAVAAMALRWPAAIWWLVAGLVAVVIVAEAGVFVLSSYC